MSKPYDATFKALFRASPGDWPRLAGVQPNQVDIIDSDVSTVTAATDKVLRLGGDHPSLMHFEFQAGPDAGLPGRVQCYNTLLRAQHGLPVHSVVVLLRRRANRLTINGIFDDWLPGRDKPYLVFQYQVLRIWEMPAADLLQGGIGTLPLAPIGMVAPVELPEVIREMKQRLEQPEYEKIAGEVWMSVRLLMGLRYQKALINQLLQGVPNMKESVTYQEILAEGRVEGRAKGRAEGRAEEARRLVLHLGKIAFDQPASSETRAVLEAIKDPQRLEKLAEGLFQAKNWEELVAMAAKPSHSRKKKS